MQVSRTTFDTGGARKCPHDNYFAAQPVRDVKG